MLRLLDLYAIGPSDETDTALARICSVSSGMCRPFSLALVAATLCLVSLHDRESLIGPQIHQALEGTSLPSDQKALIESATLKVLPIALPIAVFLIVFVVLGLLGAGRSAGPAPVEARYVAMRPERGIRWSGGIASEWSDGLFGCLNDIPVCLVSCCLPPVIVGQLYERVTGSRGACMLIVFAVGGLSVFASTATYTMCSRCTVVADRSGVAKISCPDGQRPPQVCKWADMAGMLCFLSMVALVIIARNRIRNARFLVDGHGGIEPPCCSSCGCEGCCADCCASFCCLPLAAAQSTRHLNAVFSTAYSLGSPTGTKPTAVANNPTGPLVIQVQCPHHVAAAPVPMGIPV